MELTTLIYIKKGNSYLMLHRTKKEADINKGKWIGVGGHVEYGEKIDDCARREALEETGLRLGRLEARGVITFTYGEDVVEYMHLFTCEDYEGELIDCPEGDLEFVDFDKIYDLELWEGDKIFLKKLMAGEEYFFLKLAYDKNSSLTVS